MYIAGSQGGLWLRKTSWTLWKEMMKEYVQQKNITEAMFNVSTKASVTWL